MNTTGRHNKRLPKVDRFSPPPSTIPLPSEPATNANKQTNDSFKCKRAIRQRHRRQHQRQQRQENKDQQQQQQKQRQQRLPPQQRQQKKHRHKLKSVHKELLQRPKRFCFFLYLIPLETQLRAQRQNQQQHPQVMKQLRMEYEMQQVFNRYEIVIDELNQRIYERLTQPPCTTPCATTHRVPPKTTQPAPTQTQQLRWKYGFVLHQMLTTASCKAHRDMLQSVHNELTANTPIIDATFFRPSINTVTSYYSRQYSPTNILRCLLPTSFGFTQCHSSYYFHKLRPPDHITSVKQYLSNPFETLYFFNKVRPPDDDNNVVQQQHLNSFGNSYFFSKARPPELILHVLKLV